MPLNIMWFTAILFTIIVAVLYHTLRHLDTNNTCFFVSHIVIIAYIVLVFVALGWFTKRWMVKKEAGSGRNCSAARGVSFVNVPGLPQTKLGAGALVFILVGCFGKD